MEEDRKILVPDYYLHFHCKGGACRSSCCSGWSISLTQDEYFHLLGLPCSDALRHKLDTAFHLADQPTPERYALISPTWQGDCPLHGEDGLCMLQKECGEKVLSSICRAYPRSVKIGSKLHECACSNSCEAVIELLMQHEEPLHFRLETLPSSQADGLHTDADIRLRYQCIRLMQERFRPLPERMHSIAEYLNHIEGGAPLNLLTVLPSPERLGHAIHGLCRMIRALESSSPSMQLYGEPVLARYAALSPTEAAADYDAARRSFASRYPAMDRYMENILVNHIFYEDFPFVEANMPVMEQMLALTAVYALTRLLAVTYCIDHSDENALTDVLAGTFRLIEHSRFYYNANHLMHTGQLTDISSLISLLSI